MIMATRETWGRPATAVATLAVCAIALTGCMVPPAAEGPEASASGSLTLEEAKAGAIDLRDTLAALYPEEDIADIRANATSKALMPCDGEEEFAWPGRTTITVAGTVDKDDALDAVADGWGDRAGWTVERTTSDKGFPRLVLNHDDGTHVNIAYFYDGDELWVDVVSPCFTLPGGLTLGGEY